MTQTRRYRYVGPAELRDLPATVDAVAVDAPGALAKVVFRRCPACGERNVVRDGDFTCALCDGDLPARWNFA
ncbi:hypothetical protein [Dactylosporangium salmoneum]|uniref:Uncharacterized protein n=1 Tax=Dactylosporangium salmoneum TaxID=53361 RepID=A0ABN3HAM2_9ACTN